MSDDARTEIRASARHTKRLTVALVLVAGYAAVQLVTALTTGSLSLLSDAGHMGTDSLGLGMALAAIVTATRASRKDHRTFGLYRLEIVAALANAVLLLVIGGYAIIEGVSRIADPVELEALPVLIVASGGLVINLITVWLLRSGAEDSINLEGAYLEVLADLIGSLGVILAAGIYLASDWAYADPIVAVGLGLWIVPRAFRLGRKALAIIVETAPSHVDLNSVQTGLESIDGVLDAHDIHVWTLTSDMDVATAHLVVAEDVDAHRILDEAGSHLRSEWGISHATIQVEPKSHSECLEETW